MAKVFVFGSNESGIHGAGAALVAYKKHGARYGSSYGHYGNSFAIPTKDKNIEYALSLEKIAAYVQGFLVYAEGRKKLTFQVTRVGCGLAGLKDADIAPMFKDAPDNCEFDEAWKPWLGDSVKYWGTF